MTGSASRYMFSYILFGLLLFAVFYTPTAVAQAAAPFDLGDYLEYNVDRNFTNMNNDDMLIYNKNNASEIWDEIITYETLNIIAYGWASINIVKASNYEFIASLFSFHENQPGSFYEFGFDEIRSDLPPFSDYQNRDLSYQHKNDKETFFGRYNESYNIIMPEIELAPLMFHDLDFGGSFSGPFCFDFWDYMSGEILNPTYFAKTYPSEKYSYSQEGSSYNLSVVKFFVSYLYDINQTITVPVSTPYGEVNMTTNFVMNIQHNVTVLYDVDTGVLLDMFTHDIIEYSFETNGNAVFDNYPPGSESLENGLYTFFKRTYDSSEHVQLSYVSYEYNGQKLFVDPTYPFAYKDALVFMQNISNDFNANGEKADPDDHVFENVDITYYSEINGDATFYYAGNHPQTPDIAFYGVLFNANGFYREGFIHSFEEFPGQWRTDDYSNEWFIDFMTIASFQGFLYSSEYPMIPILPQSIDYKDIFIDKMSKDDEGFIDPDLAVLYSVMRDYGYNQIILANKFNTTEAMDFTINGNHYSRDILIVTYVYEGSINSSFDDPGYYLPPNTSISFDMMASVVIDVYYDPTEHMFLGMDTHMTGTLNTTATFLDEFNKVNMKAYTNYYVNNNKELMLVSTPHYYSSAPTTSNNTSQNNTSSTTTNQSEPTSSNETQATPALPLPGYEFATTILGFTVVGIMVRKRK